ncbi:MAG TPA: ABC transporter permease [Longimicrobiales bacterium]|nr:ABC transporter permease [Longimicrobiales bacterium]
MSLWTDVVARLRSLVQRDLEERELEEELSFHLELEAARHERAGLDPALARRRAEHVLGGRDQVMESVRDARGVRPLEDLVRDVRYGMRALGRSPGFAAIAVLVVGLGVGASTAIFSAVNALILEPLPFRDPGSLYMLWESNPEKGWERETAAPANYLDWRERVAGFEDIAAYTRFAADKVLTGDGDPRLLRGVDVTGNLFPLLGVRAALGRTFTEDETWNDAERVVLLGWSAWRDHFGADTALMGTTITLDGMPHRVVGVLGEGFSFPEERLDLWLSMRWTRADRSADWFRRAHWISPIARLRPGVSAAEADAQLQAVARQLQQEHPQLNHLMGAGMTPLQEFLLGDTRTPLLVLLAAVGILLLIACANVGNLLLVKASGRQHELAVRAALGAGRGRLVRQIMTESALLAAAGGIAGLALGWLGTRVLERMQPEGLLRVSEFHMDGRVLGFAMAVSIGAALLFGSLPAAFAGRAGASSTLRETGRTRAPGRRANRVASALVIAEIALAVLLVTGAGLLVRSLWRLQDVDPGFEPRSLLAVTLNLPPARYPAGEPVADFYTRLLERVRAVPGVVAASATSNLPLRERGFTSDFFIAGRTPGDYGSEVVRRRVAPSYFETMRVPLLRGRTFTAADRTGAEPVVIINQRLAREWFGDADPLGRRIITDREPDSTSVWRTIIGVVGDERQTALALAPQIEMFESFYQAGARRMTLVIRTAGEPALIVAGIRAAVAQMDADLPLIEAVEMRRVFADSLARQRFLTLLLLTFAGLAFALAVIGVYGVTAQATRNRVPEMGVRAALGADAGAILRLNLARGLALTGLGLIIGLGIAWPATRAMRALVFEVEPTDPRTFLAVTALLGIAGLAACWLPARRASRVDPAVVLRSE